MHLPLPVHGDVHGPATVAYDRKVLKGQVNPSVTRARLAVATVFFVNGAVLATWVPHIPAVKARHGLTDGGLGFVLLAMAVGSVLALPLAGWLVDRVGSRRMTALAALGFCLLLPLPILSPGIPMLVAALALFGALNGALDVSRA